MADTTNVDAIDFTGTPSDGADAGTVALRPELAEIVDAEIVDDEPAVSRPSVVAVVARLVHGHQRHRPDRPHPGSRAAPDVCPAGCIGSGPEPPAIPSRR